MKIQHVTIQTANFKEEIGFYEKFAGLKITGDLRPKGKEIVFLSEEEGDTAIEVINVPEIADAGNEGLSIGFHAGNIDEIRELLVKDGFTPTPVISPMPGVRFFFVKDPAGVKVQFI